MGRGGCLLWPACATGAASGGPGVNGARLRGVQVHVLRCGEGVQEVARAGMSFVVTESYRVNES